MLKVLACLLYNPQLYKSIALRRDYRILTIQDLQLRIENNFVKLSILYLEVKRVEY